MEGMSIQVSRRASYSTVERYILGGLSTKIYFLFSQRDKRKLAVGISSITSLRVLPAHYADIPEIDDNFLLKLSDFVIQRYNMHIMYCNIGQYQRGSSDASSSNRHNCGNWGFWWILYAARPSGVMLNDGPATDGSKLESLHTLQQ